MSIVACDYAKLRFNSLLTGSLFNVQKQCSQISADYSLSRLKPIHTLTKTTQYSTDCSITVIYTCKSNMLSQQVTNNKIVTENICKSNNHGINGMSYFNIHITYHMERTSLQTSKTSAEQIKIIILQHLQNNSVECILRKNKSVKIYRFSPSKSLINRKM